MNLPKREKASHKGNYGKVLLIAGSSGMLGAGALASLACLRSGSGIVYWVVPAELKNPANLFNPEVIVKSYEEMPGLDIDVIVFGPGIGVVEESIKILNFLLDLAKPIIIDADGLNIISSNIKLFKKIKGKAILTPHPGEMSKLTGLSVEQVQKDRIKSAIDFAVLWETIVVLKGYQTIVANSSGKYYVNKTGNPGMSTAGSGDVLAGIIGSLVGQKLKLYDAACLAAHIHGAAGDLARKEKGEYGLIASDIIENIPNAILKVQSAE